MCSYDDKIQPHPHDLQLAYISCDTKILAVNRNIKLSAFISKLSPFYDTPNNAVCFKYQLPSEDLDALISITNDEDLDHMMIWSSYGSSPTALIMASPTNPDFLFGFDKGYTAVLVSKFPDSVTPPTVPDLLVKITLVGSGSPHRRTGDVSGTVGCSL
nr:uncharacterized protein LOC103430710 [Malus domestica]